MPTADKRDADWISKNEYPDDDDVRDFGDDSPVDYLKLEKVRHGVYRDKFWTRGRIIIAACALILLVILLIPLARQLFGLFR
jgi:hypothetical protein